ncbi:extracellular solute-binding protein [Geminicoccus roseus]|uniref:extracellular solute-binding protein n=1 Tax=Geminicoccus roseus TaxID=404900 RepID=UPI000406D712|nr:extracellular solute-binding protein [Geminicoccus roseus]
MYLSKRQVLKSSAGLVALSAIGVKAGHAQGAVSEFRMIEAGGASGESIEKGYIVPFTEKTGTKVMRESPSGLGKLRAMVEAGDSSVPLLELSSPELYQAVALDLVEPIDWEAVAPDPIFPEAQHEFGFGYQYYSTVMAWGEDQKAPKTWKEFFDTEAFPGKRALPDYPAYILPMAALAAGGTPDDLYPLDLDQAFETLERVKDSVAVWWQAGAQPPQLLKDKEVQYAVAWSGRVAGAPGIGYSFDQGLLDLAYFVVPKGADPELKKAAMGLLHEMSVAKNQAVAAEVISYTGPSPQLEELLPQDRLGEFPTTSANKSVQMFNDAQWWFENADEVEQRWQEFKLTL